VFFSIHTLIIGFTVSWYVYWYMEHSSCFKTTFSSIRNFLVSLQIQRRFNCQDPNSIEQNLRLDYILTDRSTHHTNYLLLLLLSPASQAGKLYNYKVRVQCIHCLLRRSTLKFTWQWQYLRIQKKLGGTIKWISIRPLDNFLINLKEKKFKITPSGKIRSRSTGPDFVQMLLWTV
jgi:hypothetical protein